jgi:hypothetical protein
MGGGGCKDMDGQHDTLGGPVRSHTSHWSSLWFPEFSIRLDILYNYFVTGEDDKAVFLFPAIHLSICLV